MRYRSGRPEPRSARQSLLPSDVDVYRTANTLIKQYGADGAGMHAAQRADELLEAGDMDGRRVWGKILDALRELAETKPPDEGEAVH